MKQVKIKFQNGLVFNSAVNEILGELTDEFNFIDSENPDFIVFGPYGNNIPPKGDYIRIGYYCENITPDVSNCEWAFGVPREEEINHPRYKRIQWHALDPELLKKNINAEEIFQQKTNFCNFLYSNPVPYREEFYRQLSKYKKIDAPGKSMNNMPAIDKQFKGDKWEIKRQFLTPFKFTIAFESYVYPGYQTEKLYDAMQANSIPVYCGDPLIGAIFNQESFVNAFDHIQINNGLLKSSLEKFGQYDFKDYRPAIYNSLYHKVKRKLRTLAKIKKMRIQLNKLDYRPLIEKIIELDTNPELYKAMLAQPWFKNNTVPADLSTKSRWIEIFNNVKIR